MTYCSGHMWLRMKGRSHYTILIIMIVMRTRRKKKKRTQMIVIKCIIICSSLMFCLMMWLILSASNQFYNFRPMKASLNITHYPEDLHWSYIHGKKISISFSRWFFYSFWHSQIIVKLFNKYIESLTVKYVLYYLSSLIS